MVDADGPERQDSRSYQGSDAGDNVCHPSTCIRSDRLYRVLRFRYTYGYLTARRMGTRGQTPRPHFHSKCVDQRRNIEFLITSADATTVTLELSRLRKIRSGRSA